MIIISFNEDGDRAYLEELSKDELITRLEDHYYGEDPEIAQSVAEANNEGFAGILILAGKVVVPTAKEVAVTYEIKD